MAQEGAGTKRRFGQLNEWLAEVPPKSRKGAVQQRDRLVELFRAPRRLDVLWWRQVGVCLQKLTDAAPKNYGSGLIELVADLVEPGREPDQKAAVTQLYLYREIARKMKQSEIRKLAKLIREGRITASHVVNLAALDESLERDKMVTQCLTSGWSSHELKRQIQGMNGLGSLGGRRFRPRATRNPGVAAREIILQGERFIASCEAYFQEGGVLQKSPPKNADDAVWRELERVHGKLKEIADKAAQSCARIGQSISKSPGKTRSTGRSKRS
ncbi:MAG TPA: hypothetical protein PLF81_18690 [Candidatus Anammoximicrobium sp.]|nr:hypothetical protein [Candidatus Anammoximicrobium sp.]